MQRMLLIWLLLCWGAVSCTPEDKPAGSLRIAFETGALQTKAGDGVVADGGEIYIGANNVPDLVILIADSSGAIVATYPSSGRDGIKDGSVEGTPEATQMSVSFSGLPGNNAVYTVYAFANTTGLWTMKSGDSVVSNLTALTTAAQVEALQFEPIAADLDTDGCLAVKNSRLPLSAKGAVTLQGNGNGEISLAMLRCVAKVTAVFENQYGDDLTLLDFSNTFFHMRPETGYVVPHQSDFPVSWASADPLIATEGSLSIASDDQYSKSWYVFPSMGPYTCTVSFTATISGNTNNYSYPDLPVHDDHARDIPHLARNQHLTITTRISKGKQVSFNFEVADWITEDKTESVYFD